MLTIKHLPYIFHTGGRHEAGYKGYTRDCVVRALAVITERPYKEVYEYTRKYMKANPMYKQRWDKSRCSPRYGVYQEQTIEIAKHFGLEWIEASSLIPNGGYYSVNEVLPRECVIRIEGHLVAYKDGVLYDTGNPSTLRRNTIMGIFVKKVDTARQA